MSRPPRTAAGWARRLRLQPHPEGGWFREIYRSGETVPRSGLPERFDGPRPLSTAIYYLLGPGEFSAFHRIRSDEAWHWYAGGTLDILVLQPDGRLDHLPLSPHDAFVQVVPAGRWFAARCPPDAPYVLAGCTVAPGFDFADFELADPDALAAAFPVHAETIRALARPRPPLSGAPRPPA